MLAPHSSPRKAAVTAPLHGLWILMGEEKTEGTRQSGSGSDPNLLKSLQGGNCAGRTDSKPGFCPFERGSNLVSGRHLFSLRWLGEEMGLRIIYCKVAPGYPQTWCLYSLLKMTFLKSIFALHMPEYNFHLIANRVRENTKGSGFKNVCANTHPFCRSVRPPS